MTDGRRSRAYAEEALHRHRVCFLPVPCELSVPCGEKRASGQVIRFERDFFDPRAPCKDVITREVREGGRERKRTFVVVRLCVCVCVYACASMRLKTHSQRVNLKEIQEKEEEHDHGAITWH